MGVDPLHGPDGDPPAGPVSPTKTADGWVNRVVAQARDLDKGLYRITYADGDTDSAYTYDSAIVRVLRLFPNALVGHEGDLEEGGDRTMCWVAADPPTDSNACCVITWGDEPIEHRRTAFCPPARRRRGGGAP